MTWAYRMMLAANAMRDWYPSFAKPWWYNLTPPYRSWRP